MSPLKSLDLKILSELMKNSKISDRAIAKKLGVSQPTVTRRRASLEKQRFLEHTVIPNLKKLGYGIIAITFTKYKPDAKIELKQQPELFNKKIQDYLNYSPTLS
jgi:DNA-binding Lrp family transcriptional regulator